MHEWKAATAIAAIASATFMGGAAACWKAGSVSPVVAAAYRVHVLLDEGKYDELDRESARAQNLEERLSDGMPLHAAWHDGLAVDGEQCWQLRASMDPEMMAALDRYRARLRGWLAHSPGSPAARLANALYHLQVVSVLRGNDYGPRVKREAWPLIQKNLAEAERSLDALGASGKSDPVWYQAKLQIARMRGVDVTDYGTILDEAIARFPYYEPLYLAASSYYTANWGGSDAAFVDFVELAVARTQDRLGDEMYARLYWARNAPGMFGKGKAKWSRMKAGFEHLVDRFPDAWNLNQFARCACIAGDARQTHALFERMGRPLAAAWPSFVALEACKIMSDTAADTTASNER